MTPELKKQIRGRNATGSDADILLDMVECLKTVIAEATQKNAALREAAEAAEAAATACRAVEGAAMLSDNEERFGEMVSEKLGLVQDAVTKLTAALALDAKGE